MIINRVKAALLTGTAVAAMFGGSAQAAETVAGTSVTNTASVTYTVGGNQTTTTSNPAVFTVDKKVNLTVAEVGGLPTYVSKGDTLAVTTFTVQNNTNATQDFILTVDQAIPFPLLGLGDFNLTDVHAYVDDGNGTFGPEDTMEYIDELAPEGIKTVFIVGTVPANAPTRDVVSLNAQVAAGGAGGSLGAALVATGLLTADTVGGPADIVFADVLKTGNLARDGMERAFDSYVISTATLSMVKSSTVLSDPINLLAFPKAIPGAIVQYCIVVSNAGPQAATNVNISDLVPAETTYVPGSLTVGGLYLGSTCVLGLPEDDNATGADETDLNGGGNYNAGTTTVNASIPTILPLIPLTVAFNVTVK